MVGHRRVREDNGGVEEDVGRAEVVEEAARVAEVAEASSAEADELEGVEVHVAMSERDEVGLELFEVMDASALIEYGAYMFVEARRRNHVMFVETLK